MINLLRCMLTTEWSPMDLSAVIALSYVWMGRRSIVSGFLTTLLAGREQSTVSVSEHSPSKPRRIKQTIELEIANLAAPNLYLFCIALSM